MARIRTIKPSFFQSLTIAELPIPARLTFIGLWTMVDDEGRMDDEPRLVKAALWPLDDDRSVTHVRNDLDALSRADKVCRYEVAGRRYLHVRNWRTHQSISHPYPSKIPACEAHSSTPEHSGNIPGTFQERSETTTRTVQRERKGKERKLLAPTKSTQGRPRTDVWDALMAVCQIDVTSIPPSARGAYNAAVKDLRALAATPREISRRARRYRERFAGAALTPTALARHWAELAADGHPSPVSNGVVNLAPRLIEEGFS